MNVRLRFQLAVHDLRRRRENVLMRAMRHAPRWLLRAALTECAVRATTPPVLRGDEYAGPDGVDYHRMWFAINGERAPGQ